MSYNRFQWWRSTLKRKGRPLSSKSASLKDRIRHGDFDLPVEYFEAIFSIESEMEYIAQTLTKNFKGNSEQGLAQDIRDATRMKNVRKLKLELELLQKEEALLHSLRHALLAEFKVDLWEEIGTLDHKDLNSVEDLYAYYKEKTIQQG